VTYLGFHCVFILPVIGVLAWFVRRRGAVPCPLPGAGVALVCGIALAYTAPWDHYLVAQGIWTYDTGRILEPLRIGRVPLEEYLFFILQPILAALFLFVFVQREPRPAPPLRGMARAAARIAPTLLVLAAAGAAAAIATTDLWPRGTYLALILVWACPVLAFQTGFGGDRIWARRRQAVPALIAATSYLWLVDSIAITWRIWHIAEATSTGWKFFALPIEEAIFFLATNALVIFGLLLFYDVLGGHGDAPAR